MWDDDDEYFERGPIPEEFAIAAKVVAVLGLVVLGGLAIWWSV